MPTVLREGPYRFYFFSHEPGEPPHVHLDREGSSAKFWLEPVALAASHGFSPTELRQLERLVAARRDVLRGAWHEHHGYPG